MARNRRKKLSEIVEAPKPSPELSQRAAEAGATIRAYDPERLRAFVEGRITLGQLERISKEAQYKMARVGYDLLNEGKLDAAKGVFLGLLALDPFDAYFHLAVGAVAQRQGDLPLADQHYSRSLEINPYSAVALANRGEVRLASGRAEDGVRDLAAALEQDPEAREPAVMRGRAILSALSSQVQALAEAVASAAAQPETAPAPAQSEKSTPPPKSKPASAAKAPKRA